MFRRFFCCRVAVHLLILVGVTGFASSHCSVTFAEEDEANPLRSADVVDAPVGAADADATVAATEVAASDPTPADAATVKPDDPRTAIHKTHAPNLRRDAEPAATVTQADASQAGADSASGVAELDPEGVDLEAVLSSASDADETDGDALPTVASLEQQLKQIDRIEGGDEAQKEAHRSLLRQSIEWLTAATELEKKTARVRLETEAVPTQLEQLNQQLRSTKAEPDLPETDQLSIEALETSVRQLSDEIDLVRERIAANEARSRELQANDKTSQEKLAKISEQRAEIETQLAAKPELDESALQMSAIRTEMLTHLHMLQIRETYLKAEGRLHDASRELQPLRHDLEHLKIARLEVLHGHFEAALTRKRRVESERRIADAKRMAREADPALRELAEHNADLADRLSKYRERIRKANAELEVINKQFEAQEESFEHIQSRVEEIGMTEAIGALLRSQEQHLLDDRPMRRRAGEIEKELPRVALEWMNVDDERESMWRMDEMIEEKAQQLSARFSESEANSMVRDLLEKRRQYLGELRSDLDEYQKTLANLSIVLKNSAKVTSGHRRYINEHVLWIRSAEQISGEDFQLARSGSMELLQPARWQRVVADTGRAIQSRKIASLASFLLLTVCLVLCDRLKDRITEIGESAGVRSAHRFRLTAEVAAETLVLAGLFPTVCFLVSWCITSLQDASDLTVAVGIGLRWTAVVWLGLSLLQQVVRPGGLAEHHFGWHTSNIGVVRRNLQLLTTFGLPVVLFVMMIEAFQDGKWSSSLGRVSFMAGMSVMALFMYRLLDPYRRSSGVWANRDIWPYRLRHLLHAGCVAVPLSLAILAAVGYVYSAQQLAYRAHLSLWLVLLVVLAHGLVARYLMIARRRAAVRQMQRRRQDADANENEPQIDEQLDFQAIGQQLQRLLRGTAAVTCLLGGFLIWADMIPALMMFDRVELWSYTQMVSERVELDDGQFEMRSVPSVVRITLANGLLGLLTLVATVVSARNIPGLLNVTVFERLPIDYGTRYALTAVSRYCISLIGIVTAFYTIGITWGSVQWLVAAMTVGLGFGLQEIFANFVSGLIILTERPVRVGDMVTVGGITGKVTRVQIRATTITDFDRRELVVPNKRFITEDVINWTLSDPVTRLVLPIGIGYDSDPSLARQRLLEVAAQHPLVLSEPESTAIFMGFGDSTLDLELRVFIVGRDNAFNVRDELNLAINEAFRASGLEIAYPQRDLHIKSVDGVSLGLFDNHAKKAA